MRKHVGCRVSDEDVEPFKWLPASIRRLHLKLGFRTVSLCWVIAKKFLNKVDVCHDHSPAAVTFAPKLVHCITIRNALIKEA